MTKSLQRFTLRLDAHAILDKQLKWIRGNGNIPESYDVNFHSVERIFLLPFVPIYKAFIATKGHENLRPFQAAPVPIIYYILTLRSPTRLR